MWNRSLTVSGSTFAGNTVGEAGGGGSGGAIEAGAISSLKEPVSISDSTFFGNDAGGGGASGRGGAINVADMYSATLLSVTIDGNSVGGSAGTGAGINTKLGGVTPEGAIVTAKATILSLNMGTGAANCDVPVASSSYSLEGLAGQTSCGFDLPSADPELGPLLDNEGPTKTQALPASSPAVDAVPVAKCPTTVDQRGEPRPDNGKAFCDLGAYELQDPPAAPVITSATATTFSVGKKGSFTVIATGAPVPDLSITGPLPAGVVFTDKGYGTATLSGTPSAGTGGSYPITIEASNGVLPDAAQSFMLTVQAPPAVAIATPVEGAVYELGQAVSTSFTCAEGVGGPGIVSCVDHSGRPSGKALDTATLGRHTFEVTATSGDGFTARASVTYTVKAPAPPSPSLTVAIRTARTRVAQGIAKLRLACSDGETGSACSGVLSLARRERISSDSASRRKANIKRIVLARARYAVLSGKTGLVILRLTPDALRLLKGASHRGLQVRATAAGEPSTHRTIVLQPELPPEGRWR
jgi:hypothetical protein